VEQALLHEEITQGEFDRREDELLDQLATVDEFGAEIE
jgi:hypothetical protein